MFNKKVKPVKPVKPVEPAAVEPFKFEYKKGNVLLPSLKTAINALEKDFIFYDWTRQSCCNCGVVVQALFDKEREFVYSLFSTAMNWVLEKTGEDEKEKRKNQLKTWRGIAQSSCSVTGRPLNEVFEALFSLGLRAEDIVHLEYLSNTGILEVAKIDTTIEKYYQDKNNLIKYLKAWVSILENTVKDTTIRSSRGQLESELLVAVNEENYLKAIELRDSLAILEMEEKA